jgi:hypothetical protein
MPVHFRHFIIESNSPGLLLVPSQNQSDLLSNPSTGYGMIKPSPSCRPPYSRAGSTLPPGHKTLGHGAVCERTVVHIQALPGKQLPCPRYQTNHDIAPAVRVPECCAGYVRASVLRRIESGSAGAISLALSPNREQANRAYDPLDQLLRKTYSDATATVSYAYNPADRGEAEIR